MKNSNKILNRFLIVLVAFVILAAGFSAGYFTRKLTQGSELTSLEWVLETIGENYYGDVDRRELADMSLAEIASSLDPYSEYYTKEQYSAQLRENAGVRSGIGISYNFVEGAGVRIITVLGNSPARKAGLRAGDEITGGSAGGQSAEFTTAEAFSNFMDARAKDEKFTLNVKGKSEPLEISKQVYTSSYTHMATKTAAWEFVSSADGSGLSLTETNESISYLPDGAAYINLSQFFGTAGDEFGKLIEKFNAEHCTSLILDLRNNGGGYVSVMQDIAGYFTGTAGVAMTAKYKSGKQEVYNCYKHSGDSLVPEGTEVYVLANSGTASASEALIGVLISYGILEYENIFISDFAENYLKFAGENAKTARTYGKGIMQTTFLNYFTGEALKLTTAEIFWPNGKSIHNTGLAEKDGCTIVPDVAWTATKGDKELQKVCELILAK